MAITIRAKPFWSTDNSPMKSHTVPNYDLNNFRATVHHNSITVLIKTMWCQNNGTHRRTGPFPFGKCTDRKEKKRKNARISHLCPKSRICFGNAFLPHMEGGGGGGKESRSFGVIEYGTPQRGRVWEGVSPSHGGDFLEIRVLKTRFSVRYKF